MVAQYIVWLRSLFALWELQSKTGSVQGSPVFWRCVCSMWYLPSHWTTDCRDQASAHQFLGAFKITPKQCLISSQHQKSFLEDSESYSSGQKCWKCFKWSMQLLWDWVSKAILHMPYFFTLFFFWFLWGCLVGFQSLLRLALEPLWEVSMSPQSSP